MKKIVFLLFITIVIMCLITKKNEVLIPNNAIRIRIIANSDSIEDQKEKAEIKNEVNELLFNKLKDVKDYNYARIIIKDNIEEIKAILNKYTNDYEITYGKNYFPKKEYKGIAYNEGNYESILIKLGKGKGKNFWCVLFPPLCMIDENIPNKTYKFYVNELLNKLK